MLISTLFSLAAVVGLAGAKPTQLHVQPCDFGETYQFSTVTCQIELRNSGTRPIRVSELSAGQAETKAIADDGVVVPPNGIASLDAKVEVRNQEGISKFYFRFATDEAGQERRSAEARGFVQNVFDQSLPTVDFGTVDFDKKGLKQTLTLSSRARASFRITKVIGKPSYLDVSIRNNGKAIDVVLLPGAPLGPRKIDVIKLGINTEEQSEAWVKVSTDVRADVVPSSNPFALGLMRTSNTNEFRIRLNSRSGKEFEIGNVSLQRLLGSVAVEPCVPVAKDCKQLRLLISDKQETGQIGGIISVDLTGTGQTIPIYVWGMLLTPDVKVIDYNKEIEDAKRVEGASKENAVASIDLSSALKVAVREVVEPVPTGTGPLIKWSATNEQLVYGYAVYRSTDEEGPFIRLNRSSILTKSTDGSGSNYQWRDNSAVSGNNYWYYIGLLNRDGTKQQLSAPQEIIAK